jgi:hypothetical protein
MAKAYITTKSGTKVTIEGSPDEVAALIVRFEGSKSAPSRSEPKSRQRQRAASTGPVALVSELIDGGFFKKPKELSAIKIALEEQGHYYPVTSLSPVLLRLVRRRSLRRIKDKKRWLYVG